MSNKKYHVVALGELLIDFTEDNLSIQGNPLYEANPGGAPCNVLSMLNNLGKKTSFIGKVGNDQFGIYLKETLDELGIGNENLVFDNEVNTTLAFVKTLDNGDRDFSFYRNPGADMMLRSDEINEELLKSTEVFHFGTLSMTHINARKATKKALDIAIENDAIISFDPNLREHLWESLEDAKKQVLYGLGKCHILKIADNEIKWLTGEDDFTRAVNKICEHFDIPLILVSMGREGSRAYYNEIMIEAPAFLQENTIETTGAGDTFCACIINYILENGLQDLSPEQLEEMLTFANAAASIITTRKGALRVMPTKLEVYELIKKSQS
ncbi:MAG TPA: carbohydrate kinase [Clostridiales bacterium]|nr:carbohydrate kinase [Clostridiales bacterium]